MARNCFCLIIAFLFSYNILWAQNANYSSGDSLSNTNIDAIEIPGESANALVILSKIEKSMLKNDQLKQMQKAAYVRLDLIDSLFNLEKEVNYNLYNKRHLVNKRSYWNQRLEQVNTIENAIIAELEKLEANTTRVKAIAQRWNYIAQSFDTEQPDSLITVSIQRLSTKNSSVLSQIQYQSRILLSTQDKVLSQTSSINRLLETIQQRINDEEDNLFIRSQLHFKEVFNPQQYVSAASVFMKNVRIEMHLLTDYINANQGFVLLYIFILVSGVLFFRQLNRTVVQKGEYTPASYFQLQFNKLLSAYRSTALVLIVWLTALLFPNQPLLFKDIIRVIICIPLSILLYRLIERRLFISILLLFTLVFVQVIINLFPPNHMIYKVFLLIASIIEFTVLIRLYRYASHKPFTNQFMANVSKRVLLIAIIAVGIIMIMGLFGYVVLTELLVNVILTNTFSISLLFVSLLIINGTIEYIFDFHKLQQFMVVKHFGAQLKKRLTLISTLAAQLMAIYIILISLNIDEEISSFVKNMITYQFQLSESISFSLGGFIMLILILYLSILLSNMIKVFLEEDILSKTNLGQGLPHTIALLAKYTLITIGITMAISMAGIPTTSLTVLIGAFGVGIGFGLQNIFNNLVSGLILLFERPIKIDDIVEVGQLLGRVKSIGIRSSIVRTFDGAEVIVPNGQLISNEVINWTHSDPIRRHEVFVGVAYGSNVSQVRNILEAQLNSHTDILKDPPPSVLFINMGDSSLDFRLLFWISKVQEGLKIKSDITQMIYDALNKEGIQIPFPQRDIHIIKDKSEEAK
ncbi:MAG: mechanosensitive ion channel [Carboxylicivirga sp.]|jgi:small-conductance mechanosensitive channel|nr:mechanosensitive ion channel [Carboxylicivirga sp.]